MADYLTRIELFEADEKQHVALSLAMQTRGFSTFHISSRGITYQMPEDTFFSQSDNMSVSDVRNLALAAVRNIGCKYNVVTMKGEMAYFLHPAR